MANKSHLETEIDRLLVARQTVRQIASSLGIPRLVVEERKKQHVARIRARRSLGWAFLGLTAIVVALAIEVPHLYRSFEQDSIIEELRKTALSVEQDKPAATSTWLVSEEFQGPQLLAIRAGQIDQLADELDRSVARVEEIPEIQAMIAKSGKKFLVSIFSPPNGIMHIAKESEAFDPAGKIEVTFFGPAGFNTPIVQGLYLSYQSGFGSVFVAALRYPDPRWFDAFLWHELLHRQKHLDHAASATAPFLSDVWASEEVQGHELARKILDHHTRQAYSRTLAEIARNKWAWSLKNFLRQLRARDLESLEDLFVPGSKDESRFRSSQYLLDLSFVWLKQRQQGQKLIQAKIEAYRLLATKLGRISPSTR
ncbi:MAG: hypothetical protein A3E98_02670 [Candidatus Doudnabacteria bacterium RIFCSPHIGHO2_12_FULL_48_11]|uniref:Uncharacterized protein n=1 Tax=Candidatus Doudnabacteria bacterium RIFCSPHIGHO2_01_FULL_46_24 TaxID=1817825 RepID=A0A1F5NSV6_9BACT|nr:MAG: hypothetical protein A2720_04280 [Candidatus Doudnabacteria bacterium RIFCSPHIGHO2_01_FULL_46_24]OGE94135.1 MAG: hypothetical protein A3E98_02670 [Candidatus Doudnabacteria bacterium RIFCSPHIGHO2_12_FULL_48_11]